MDLQLPEHLVALLADLDHFIEEEIAPLQAQDDNDRFFDHRREHSRTDWDRQGLPNEEWEALLGEMRRRADAAGFLRYHLPERFGGRGGSNLDMAVIREHLAAKGLGLFNDLQNESSIVGNFPTVLMMEKYGSEAQQEEWIPKMLAGKAGIAFGLTEPNHGSDATWMETRAERDGDEWVINGEKMWNTGVHKATHDFVFARTSGEDGEAAGISCFIVPMSNDGVQIEEYYWTFNMPTDHARVSFTNVRVRAEDVLGPVDNGLQVAQLFVHENRIRQAASSLGAAQYCIDTAAGLREVARREPGHPVPARRAPHRGRDAAGPHPPDGVGDGRGRPRHGDLRQGRHVQLPRQPPRVRRRRPGHADLWWHGLLPPHGVRAHLPPPPPLPDHRGRRGDPDPPRRRPPLRVHRPGPGLHRHLTLTANLVPR
jgi:acyl-CoA dehydrogenase